MARPKIYRSPKRTNILIEETVHAEANARLQELGIDSFSEYVSRLIRADLRNKGSAALRVSRFAEAAS